MPLLKAYAVPHPPLLVPEVGRGEETKIPQTLAAMRTISADIADLKPDVIIVSSPHAPYFADAFFVDTLAENEGSFIRFGAFGKSIRCRIDADVTNQIRRDAAAEGLMTVGNDDRESLDHATLVPLSFINERYDDYKLVRVGLSQLGGESHVRLGALIRRLIDRSEQSFVFVASGDLSHYLKEDGPYGFRPEGAEFDERVMAIFRSGQLSDLLDLPPLLVRAAGQCGYDSFLILLGLLGEENISTRTLAYDNYFGVGYGSVILEPERDGA